MISTTIPAVSFNPRLLVVCFVLRAWAFVPLRRQGRGRASSLPCPNAPQPTTANIQPASTSGSLGLPEVLAQLEVGDALQAFRTTVDGHRRNMTIDRISHHPSIFVVRDCLSHDECQHLISKTTSVASSPALTVTDGDDTSRTRCRLSWLSPRQSPLVANMMTTVGRLFLPPSIQHSPFLSVEDLQVLRYESGGEFVLHVDGEPRVLTVLYYLNGRAGTWFPLADTAVPHLPQNKQQAMELARRCEPGQDGFLLSNCPERSCSTVPVGAGDAVVFYNYLNDGRVDWRSLHAGLPADDTKWIANHWFRVDNLTSPQVDV